MSKSTGPACGNNPNYPLTDGDRQAVAEFRAYLKARADDGLRDRIAEALASLDGWSWTPDFDRTLSPVWQGYLKRAAAIMPVLPPPADRAAILREAADALAALDPTSAPLVGYHARGEDIGLLRRMAAEAQQQPECAECGHPEGAHREGDDPVSPGQCTSCPNDDGWHDYTRAAGAQQPPDTETHDPKCVCGHPTRLHHEDVCTFADCNCADCLEPEGPLPDRLEAVLTRRFTELGNPFSRMVVHEQGPDGWPATHEVGPHKVAEVLRELMADEEQPTGPGVVVEAPATHADETDRIVAYRSKGGRLLRCFAHAPEQEGIDSGDFHPVTSEDLPDGGVCTFPVSIDERCGVDVLITPKEA